MSTLPIPRLSCHLLHIKAPKKSNKKTTRMITSPINESKVPSLNLTSFPETVLINQGSPKPSKISNTLEPSALQTAMSPSPCWATAMDPKASGMEVPAARGTKPMTRVGIFMMVPIRLAASTMTYVQAPMYRIEKVKSVQHHSGEGNVNSQNTIRGSLKIIRGFCTSFSSGAVKSGQGLESGLVKAAGCSVLSCNGV